MANSKLGSLLHPNISKFYKIDQISECKNTFKCINKDCTFNWNTLEKLLLFKGEWSKEDSVYPKNHAEYLPYFELLQPVLHQSNAAISQSTVNTNDDANIWLSKLQWLGHPTQMLTVLQEHLQPSSETSTVENILFLTAILENGLSNVYYTITKKSPPHLLRDLLDTKELRNVFGICPIFFLKIILGSPDSVNLRNIVWHGFPLPSEVPPFYSATLFIAAASLSDLIKEKQINLLSRRQIQDFSRHVLKIKAASIDFTLLDDIPRMVEAVDNSKWTGHSKHKAFWYQILQHYQSGHYWQLVILILPQIELILRRMYGEANTFDITAKLEEYYITMDTIFESKNNQLLNGHLSKGTLHLLYDVFISPYGMRIRDKVSHGEVDLNCINRDLCLILLYVGLNLINNYGYHLDQYQTRCHLNFLAYECICASKKCVLEVVALKTPCNYELDFNWDKEFIATLQQLDITRPVEIFDRHRKEPEIISISMRIAQLVVQVCENYKNSFGDKFQMFLNHELRSRSRKTLDRMVQSMAVIGETLGNVVQCIARLSNLIQGSNYEWFEDKFEKIQRFCKQTLTITENLVRFSDKGSNEWLNALECCNGFQELSNGFLIMCER